ncbi:MAG: DUF3386 family protein [Nitrospira sp.]|nr:DUF3386 family protein [Nitrospira sp.]
MQEVQWVMGSFIDRAVPGCEAVADEDCGDRPAGGLAAVSEGLERCLVWPSGHWCGVVRPERGCRNEGGTVMTPVESKRQTLVDDPAARLLVKDAHSRMYKWPASFAGYRANMTLNEDGRIWAGSVTAPAQERHHRRVGRCRPVAARVGT